MPFDDPAPAWTVSAMWRWLPALVVALLICGGVTYAGHVFGWWLAAQDTTRQAENTQDGYSNQVTLRQQVTANFTTLTSLGAQLAATTSATLAEALRVERAATGNTICADAAQVTGTPLPAQQAAWVTANCVNGSLAVSSSDFEAGEP